MSYDGDLMPERMKAHIDRLAVIDRMAGVDEGRFADYTPDGTTEADLRAQWEAQAQAVKDRAAFDGNREQRRARERDDRRAAKRALIERISRGGR